MKVAIVHDFLREYGGAERVVEVLHELYPDAPIFTAFVDFDGLGPHAERLKQWDIRTTWAQSIPFIKKLYSPLRFLAPSFFSSLDLSEYDVIISSANAYSAKCIKKKRPNQIHICYCHTPPRSLYGYPTARNWQKHLLTRMYGTIVNHYLRIVDFNSAQNVDYFIANSKEVQNRIKKFYRRDSVVIYPPLPISIDEHSTAKGEYYLYVGRLTYSRHLDIAIEAFNSLKKKLVLVGQGAEKETLEKIAGKTITFTGYVSDSNLAEYYQNAKAVIYPAENEDFGIVPIEAMAYGLPVIASASGGILETVIDKKTGVFFKEFTKEAIIEAVTTLEKLHIDPNVCKTQAKKFSKETFMRSFKEFVATHS